MLRFGMHYQWGRKDPFTPSTTSTPADWTSGGSEVQIYKANGTAITKGSGGIGTTNEQEFKLDNTITTTINNLIQNPSTHYTKGDGTNKVPIASTEYYNTTNKGDWWNPTIKTIYDPCPNGYRIPEYGTYGETSDWTILTWEGSVLTAGQIFNKTSPSFLPASGRRSSFGGAFYNVGFNGLYWMSTPYNSTYGHYLHTYINTVNPNHRYFRADGNSVRCIKEQ